MGDVLLHLWRTILDATTNNSFFGMDQQRAVLKDAVISARSNGTFERFILRIVPDGSPNFGSGNASNSIVTLDLLINGIVIPNSKIEIDFVGQTGTFLPISQLPVGFFKDDEIAVRLTGMSPVNPNPFPFVRMEIDFNLKFDILPDVILPNKIYLVGHTQLGSAGQAYRSIGGSPSLSGIQDFNRVPAMGSGVFKKLRTNIYIDTGDNLDVRTIVNGVSVLHPGALEGVGIHETSLEDRAFVKDDLIGISLGRTSSSGTIQYNTQIEVEYEETEFWFYSANRVVGPTFAFWSILDSSIISNTLPGPNNRIDFQKTLGREGIIKDFVYYGTAPAGSGETKWAIEVNDVVQFETPNLPVTGVTIHRFDNVNVPIQANDLVNLKLIARDGTAARGQWGIRVQLI